MKILTPEALPNLLQTRDRRPRVAIVSGIFVLAILTWLRISLNDVLGGGLPFLMYVLAVMWASWVGGWLPGIVVTLLCALVADYFFLGAPREFWPIASTDVGRTVVFLVVGSMVSAFSEALHRSRERIEERTRELQVEVRERRAHERERAEMQERKDQFLAILAHELRNPLTPIVNAAALLHARESGDAIVERAARMIDRHARQMVHLIDDLLDAVRLERGTFELRRECVDVESIIEAAVEHCRPAMLEKGQQHTIDLPPVPVRIRADHLRMVQVVTNLLNNASSYTPEGGHIETLVRVEGDSLHLEVRDNGQGMVSADTERIFQMFERGSGPGSARGLGIGLALVRQIVALHGGRVRGASEGPGRGSTFTVILPGIVTATQAAVTPPDAPEPLDAMRTYNILVVDDNPDLVETLVAVLQMLGHQVESACNGDEALARMASAPPDLVLMDVGMPGMSGYEVARRVALESWRSRLTLVAMTGWGRDEDRQRALDAGFDIHVVKPLDLEHLRALLDSLDAPQIPVQGQSNG
ncbi:MAG: response regulator [Gemmatimonadota bacterium]